MSISEIVSEYNQLENRQQELLTELFRLVNSGRGHRFVRFGQNHMWVNCWGLEERIVLPKHVHSMNHVITEVDAGIE